MSPRKRTGLTIEQKLQILELLTDGKLSRKEIAIQFKCDLSTISRILQKKEIFEKTALENRNLKRKRNRKGHYEKINEAITVWFNEMRLKGNTVTGPLVIEQAKKFAIMFKMENFEPSNGWLWRWKKKENISFQRIQGEENQAEGISASEWINNVLPRLLNSYTPKNVFSADESALYYKALHTTTKTDESFTGDKPPQDQMTILFLCNMDGSYRRVYAVGREKHPNCFKGKVAPVQYYNQPKSWMDSFIWTNILSQLDEEFGELKRKIILFVDNAACHKYKSEEKLANIEIQFLPANISSLIQPFDRGIIHCFKAHYRQIIIKKQLFALKQGISLSEYAESITILEALKFVKRSWWLVSPQTIQNSFEKAGFIKKSCIKTHDIEKPDYLSLTEEYDEYVKCDRNVQCYGALTEHEIVEQKRNSPANDSEEDDVSFQNDVPPPTPSEALNASRNDLPTPSRSEALHAATILRSYFTANYLDLEIIKTLEKQLKSNDKIMKQKHY